MVRAFLIVVTIGGCSYHGRSLDTDGPPGAADAADDAGVPPPDAPADAPAPPIDALVTDCVLETDDAMLDSSGQAGGDGGGPNPGMNIECDRPTDVIVGITLKISDAVIFYGARSALAIDITCAPVTVRSNGTAIVGATYTHEATGSGAESWSPATATTLAQCPPDHVVTGFDVHTGASGHLFQNANVTCAQIGATGAATGVTTSIYVGGSLADPNGDDPVPCSGNHILRRLDPRTGSGLDAVTLRCAPVRCGS